MSALQVGPAKNAPYKGTLVQLIPDDEEKVESLRKEALGLPEVVLTPRQLCDLEMILNGGFSPLTGFLNEADYHGVVENMRLANGVMWPMPITLDVSKEVSEKHKVGDRIALRDEERNILAILSVESIYVPNKAKEAENVFGSPDDVCHPAIDYLLNEAGEVYIGGSITGIQLPPHYDFTDLRMTPLELRQKFKRQCYQRIVGFQTRNPMHRSHRELTLLAARDAKANILIHPVVGMTKPGDVDHYTRVRCYKEILKTYPNDMASLSLLPIAMRMAGPREAVWHAIIRKNYGCTHFIVGRDHAGPGNNKNGEPFYDPYGAQNLLGQYAEEIGIEVLMYHQLAFVEDLDEYRQTNDLPQGCRVLNISGTELRRRLQKGMDIPPWFSFPEVVKILRQTHRPRSTQGFTIFFTGLSGSGKSTVANAIRIALLEEGSRTVSVLDGDHVRRHLSTELGFSKEHRDLNIRRIAYVASEITKAGGVAVCAAIAPYAESRAYAKRIVSKHGGFIEIHMSTPLEICESRDRTGLYAKARAGQIQDLTGIQDPYEAPTSPDIVIDTSICTPKQAVHEIILWLEREGYIGRHD